MIYACIVAGVATFSDVPCDRPAAAGMSLQNAQALAQIQDSPPRLPEGWGMDPIQVGVRQRGIVIWTRDSTGRTSVSVIRRRR